MRSRDQRYETKLLPCPLAVYSSYLHNHKNLFTHSIPSHFEVAKFVITSKALKVMRKSNSHIYELSALYTTPASTAHILFLI